MVKRLVFEVLGLFAGNLLLAFAVGLFILPNNVLSGGVAGISLILQPFIPLESSLLVLIINVLLLGFGWLCLGTRFMINSCVSSILYPVLLMIIEHFFTPPSVDPLLAAVFGGILSGFGVGLVVRQGASTGGMDIPPLIINKYFRFDVSKAVMVTDAITVLGGLYVYGFEEVLIGLVSVFMTGIGLKQALTYGETSAKYLQIISNDYEAISQDIQDVLSRGTTLIDAEGGYTKERKKLLLAVVSDKEYQHVLDIINKHDPTAFVIVTQASDVHGEGFSDIVRI